jgi:hypothetical protein
MPQGSDIVSVLVLSGLILLLCVVGFVLITWVRGRLKADDTGVGQTGFTLADLRRLHKQGQMTDEEYERARSQLVALAQRAVNEEQDAIGPPQRLPPQNKLRSDDEQGPIG